MADSSSRKGARYADPSIADHVARIHAPHDAALQQAYDAPGQHGMPAIQVSASEGKLLTLLARLAGARKIVEIGALAGYSTIRLAHGLSEGGRLWSLEVDPKHARVARDNVAAAGLDDRVEVRVGAALDLLADLAAEGPFDLVFVDADKENYAEYGRWAADHLRPGGLLVGDNAYLFGNLLSDSPAAAAVRAFHEEAAERFDSVCVPTPDGLVVGMRRGDDDDSAL